MANINDYDPHNSLRRNQIRMQQENQYQRSLEQVRFWLFFLKILHHNMFDATLTVINLTKVAREIPLIEPTTKRNQL